MIGIGKLSFKSNTFQQDPKPRFLAKAFESWVCVQMGQMGIPLFAGALEPGNRLIAFPETRMHNPKIG